VRDSPSIEIRRFHVFVECHRACSVATADVKERFAGVGADTVASSPAQYGAFVEAELRKWEKVIKATGVKIE